MKRASAVGVQHGGVRVSLPGQTGGSGTVGSAGTSTGPVVEARYGCSATRRSIPRQKETSCPRCSNCIGADRSGRSGSGGWSFAAETGAPARRESWRRRTGRQRDERAVARERAFEPLADRDDVHPARWRLDRRVRADVPNDSEGFRHGNRCDVRLLIGIRPLDVLLVDAALGPVRRFRPDLSTAQWAMSLARRPRTTARRVAGSGAEAGRIAHRYLEPRPRARDRRFTDVAWTENPLLKRWSSSTWRPAAPSSSCRRRRPRPARPRAGAVPPGQPGRGGRRQQRPPGQPGLGQGGHRHRRGQPGPRRHAAGQGPRLGATDPGDGRHQRLRARREHRGHARARSSCAPRCSS